MLLFASASLAAYLVVSGGYVLFSYAIAFGARPSSWRSARFGRAIGLELLAVWLLIPLWPLWWLVGGLYKAAQEGVGEARGRRNPIVLLHGFGMNRTQWIWMGMRLRARGHGPIYGMNYFSLQRVERSAAQLARFVDGVLAREGTREVDVVAHSLGGLVARMYIEHLGGGAKIARLVTIGTPHRGSRLGRFGILIPAARDLVDGSRLLATLGPVRPEAAYTSIWSRADAVVQPPESSSIAPAGADEVFDDLGHLSLILSPRVLDVIDARLRA